MGAGINETRDYHSHNSFSQVFQTFEPSAQVLKDISYGKEDVPVSAANSVDNSLPEYIEYSKERLPQNGVNDTFMSACFDITSITQVPLTTDPGFLAGCDCADDCR